MTRNAAVQNTATAARSQERDRITAIMSHDNARSRTALARHLALETDQSVEVCLGILAVAASESTASSESTGRSDPATPFASYMARTELSDAAADDASNVVALARRTGLKGFAKED